MKSLEEDKVCKICFECENRSNPLINPCLCKGTSKWVHENCLKSWLSQSHPSNILKKCEICKYTYKIVISKDSNRILAKIKQNPRIFTTILVLLLIFVSSIYLFGNLCAGSYKFFKDDESLFISMIVLIIFLQVCIISCLFDLINRIRTTISIDYKIHALPADNSSIVLTTLSDLK